MASAKLMADAAKSALAHDTEKIDKAKVAGAAGNLLGAAKHYGKLDEKSYGKYVGKAETYLHKYNSSSSSQSQSHSSSYTSTTTPHSSGYGGPHDGGDGKYSHATEVNQVEVVPESTMKPLDPESDIRNTDGGTSNLSLFTVMAMRSMK
uniref:Uncharacterized protein n=1 Tax=Chenopodium quinoa TaxID=63459 RepID=A0A803L7W3_CHEQI